MALITVNSWSTSPPEKGLLKAPIPISILTENIISVVTKEHPYKTTGITEMEYSYDDNSKSLTAVLTLTDSLSTISAASKDHVILINSFSDINGELHNTASPMLIGISCIQEVVTRPNAYSTTGVSNISYVVRDNEYNISINLIVTQTLAELKTLINTGGGSVSPGDLADGLALKVNKAGDTMSGQLMIGDVVNQTKIILAKHPTGSFSDAPTAFDLTSSYLHLGGVEYANNSYRLLTFGYRRNLDKSHAPAVIGYQETSTTSEDKGRLIFATRDVTTDTAPTVRLHIETNGDIVAQTGAKFVGDGSGLTGVVPTGTERQVLGYNSGGTAEAVTIGWKQLSDLPSPPPFANGVLTGTAFNPDGTALFAFIQLDVDNAAVPTSIPIYTNAGRLPVANGVAVGDAVNLGQLNGRLSAAQRTAINALVATTSTTEDVINALKAI